MGDPEKRALDRLLSGHGGPSIGEREAMLVRIASRPHIRTEPSRPRAATRREPLRDCPGFRHDTGGLLLHGVTLRLAGIHRDELAGLVDTVNGARVPHCRIVPAADLSGARGQPAASALTLEVAIGIELLTSSAADFVSIDVDSINCKRTQAAALLDRTFWRRIVRHLSSYLCRLDPGQAEPVRAVLAEPALATLLAGFGPGFHAWVMYGFVTPADQRRRDGLDAVRGRGPDGGLSSSVVRGVLAAAVSHEGPGVAPVVLGGEAHAARHACLARAPHAHVPGYWLVSHDRARR